MSSSYDLAKLDPNVFEHLVNFLALEVLGAGTTGFGPGPDGGRDGYLKGEAPYPTATERWSGRWYIQSKFHQPHLSKNAQKWLYEQIQQELKVFERSDSKREWPDNWIIATNIEPSGKPRTGAYDRACKLVRQATAGRKFNFDIWGGRKILDFLTRYPKAAEYYGHFLTPGHVLKAMYDHLQDVAADVKTILRYLIVNQFKENQYTKLDQAGSSSDVRPGIHELFIDLPFHIPEYDLKGLVTEYLVRASSRCHRPAATRHDGGLWREWNRQPDRARVWVLKAGPGQGKSTIGQYFSQIQPSRADRQLRRPPGK